ncbi:hypothetical protein [Sphingobium aromaticiconvertens]|uniref:hypothetical protein n=1 Tax=Sphingobium aromaticiconvertens TaxID=365341 RepID=UPI003017BA81
MALLGWIIGFIALFGGLALRQDMPVGGSATIANGLFVLALLACPLVWNAKPLGISRGQRIAAGLALILCLPIILFPA